MVSGGLEVPPGILNPLLGTAPPSRRRGRWPHWQCSWKMPGTGRLAAPAVGHPAAPGPRELPGAVHLWCPQVKANAVRSERPGPRTAEEVPEAQGGPRSRAPAVGPQASRAPFRAYGPVRQVGPQTPGPPRPGPERALSANRRARASPSGERARAGPPGQTGVSVRVQSLLPGADPVSTHSTAPPRRVYPDPEHGTPEPSEPLPPGCAAASARPAARGKGPGLPLVPSPGPQGGPRGPGRSQSADLGGNPCTSQADWAQAEQRPCPPRAELGYAPNARGRCPRRPLEAACHVLAPTGGWHPMESHKKLYLSS